MKIERVKDDLLRWGMNLFMLLVFWGGMLRKSFNADTISHITSNDADIVWNIADGRYVIALGDAVLLKFGLRITDNLSIALLLAFFLFAVAMVIIQKIFSKWQPKEQWAKIGYFCGLNLVFLNVLFAELLMFSECSFYFAIGYLLAVLGVERYTRKKYVQMFLLFYGAACTYQYTMIFAAILMAFYIYLKHKGDLTIRVVGEELAGILSCLAIGGLNYLSIKVFAKIGIIEKFGKYAGWGESNQKFADFKTSLVSLYKSSLEILPDLWIPLLFIMALFLLIIYSCLREGTIKKLPFILIVYVGSMVLLYGIPFVQESFSFPPRMAFCFYLLQGMLVIVAYVMSTMETRALLTLGCAGYLMIQLLFSDFVVTDHFISNTLDEVYVNMMYQEILKYEQETGIEITKIAVYKDADAPDNYDEISYHVHQINERTLGTATNSLIFKVTGRKFENIGGQQEVYDQYFKEKNWNYLDLSEQLIIIDDTVYWCIF